MARPQSIWTDEESAQCRLLYEQGLGNREIAVALHRTHASVGWAITRMRTLGQLPATRTRSQLASAHGWADYSQDEEFFDEPKAEAERAAILKEFRGVEVRGLVLSDLHGIFRHHEVLDAAEQAIRDHRLNVLFVPGDILDQYCVSRFTKYKHIALETEVMEMAKVLRHFSKLVNRVVIAQGNHDMRAARLIADKLPQLTIPLKNATNFLQQCAEGLNNVTPLESWWFQVGDVIFCHREKYMKQERSTGESNLRYFENRGVQNIGLVVQAHVHRMCYMPLKRGTFYLENPMAAYRADYTYESRSLDAILATGYSVVIIGKDGKFRPNETRPYIVSWE